MLGILVKCFGIDLLWFIAGMILYNFNDDFRLEELKCLKTNDQT